MRFLTAVVSIPLALCGALCTPAIAAPRAMTPVPANSGFCADPGDGMCYEWKLEADPSLRVIAYGFEDGIDYSFYRRDRKGGYRRIVDFHPAMQDPTRPGQLFWGYAWDVHDIVLAPDGKSFQATFDHAIVIDGNVDPMPGQKRTPAVLFVGRATQPDMKVKALRFQANTIDALRIGAGLRSR